MNTKGNAKTHLFNPGLFCLFSFLFCFLPIVSYTFNYVSDTNINAVCVIDLCFNYPSFIINPWATLSMYLEDYKMLYFTTFIMYWNQYPDIDSESTGQYHGCRFSLSIPNPLVSLYNRWREEYRLPDWVRECR